MVKIVALFNHKGGVSKTTTVFNLAWMLSTMGKVVIMADFDPQCNLTGMVLGYKGVEDLEGNLLSGIIHVATTEPLDDYVSEQFFLPMDIKSWNWWRDSDSNACAMGSLQLFPEDFAKFGLLMQQNGQWNGKQLVPADWVKQSGMQSQPYLSHELENLRGNLMV